MSFFTFVIAISAFLAGGVSAIFLMLVFGIRKGDRTRFSSSAQDTPLDTFTRTVLGTGTWPSSPAGHIDRDES